MIKRNYPPGIHGSKGYGRQSSYGQQLREKQKVKRMYGLLERQFHGYYEKAQKKSGKTTENMARLLTLRLDNIVYLLGLAKSRNRARQLINHGHFKVNNRRMDIPSYQVRVKDTILVSPNKQKSVYWQQVQKTFSKTANTPTWINFEAKDFSAQISSLPLAQDLEQGANYQLIVEFYSK